MKKLFTLFISAALLFPVRVYAQETIDLEIERTADKFNLGVAPFFVSGRSTPDKMGSTYRRVVVDDMTFSTLFNVVTQGPAINKTREAMAWSKLGSEFVLTGTARLKSKGRIQLNAKLIDVKAGKTILTIKKKGVRGELRSLSHAVSDEVVEYFTGIPGIFNRKLAFVNDKSGRKELFVADYDGKNIKQITYDNSIVILPRISRDGKKMIFTSYRAGNPDMYFVNIDGSGRRKLSSKAGLNVSPSWNPNGEEFAITLSINDSPSIYLMDFQGKVKERLTRTNGADTAPAFSPDGSQIVFTSDRSGSPHIYVMNVDGTDVRRLTTRGHCDSAAWSPDGQTIVYTKGRARQPFDIYSIDVQTGIERRLTWAKGNSENPAWSPDGRFVIFSSARNGKPELFIMTKDGSDQRRLINLKGRFFTPHWGS